MKFIVAFMVLLVTVAGRAANPAFQDFNANQFGVNGNKVRLQSGVIITNPVIGSGTLTGRITTGAATNENGSRVAYLSDTNGLGGGGGTYTNNATGIPGTITGLGVSTNDINLPKLNAPTNHFTGDVGASLIGVDNATATTLSVTTITGSYANQYGYWNSTSNLVGTNAIAIANFIGPTNSAAVGQVLTATSTTGASKWDYVNQVVTNAATGSNANFNLPFSRFTIGTAFTWTAPANVDTTLTKLQVADVAVTNSTAAAVLAAFAGSVRVTGTPYVTNVTYFHWRVDPWMTNCLCEPVF